MRSTHALQLNPLHTDETKLQLYDLHNRDVHVAEMLYTRIQAVHGSNLGRVIQFSGFAAFPSTSGERLAITFGHTRGISLLHLHYY
jgi:hypothetical protein